MWLAPLERDVLRLLPAKSGSRRTRIGLPGFSIFGAQVCGASGCLAALRRETARRSGFAEAVGAGRSGSGRGEEVPVLVRAGAQLQVRHDVAGLRDEEVG